MEAYWQEHGVLAAAAEREPISIEAACGEFLSDERARGLRDSTRYKYELLFKQLKAFARRQGLRFLRELDLPVLRKFRASWPNENFSAQKKLESLRTFFRFAQAGGWITENPAAKLERQKTWRPQVLPFTRVEMIRILAACDAFSVMRVLE